MYLVTAAAAIFAVAYSTVSGLTTSVRVSSGNITTTTLQTTLVHVTIVTQAAVTLTSIFQVAYSTVSLPDTPSATSPTATPSTTSEPTSGLPVSARLGLYVPAATGGALFGLFTYQYNSVPEPHSVKKFVKDTYLSLSSLSILLSFVSTVLSEYHFENEILEVVWAKHFNVATDVVTIFGAVCAFRGFFRGNIVLNGSFKMWKDIGFVIVGVGAAITGLCSSAISCSKVKTPFTHSWVELTCWVFGAGIFFFGEAKVRTWRLDRVFGGSFS